MDTKTLDPAGKNKEFDMDTLSSDTCTKINYGANIRAIRKALGLSQENLATDINATQAKVSSIENSRSIDPKTLQTVAKALGVTVGFIEKYNPNLQGNRVLNVYDSQNVGIDIENANGTTNITNSLDVIKFMANSLTESYQQTIVELKDRLGEYKAVIEEFKAKK